MSKFECVVTKVDSVEDHPNADRLSIVKIGGYNCISAKLEDGSHRYQKGDAVVYIPEQAIMPEWLLRKMNFWNEEADCGTLSGSKGNRVKAAKLRGIVSQGIIYGDLYKESEQVIKLSVNGDNKQYVSFGEDVAHHLDIEKYEPEIPSNMAGIVGSMYGYTKSYDIENLQKYPDVFNENDEVVVTEKLHGTCFIAGFHVGLDKEVANKFVRDEYAIRILPGAIGYTSSKGMGAKGLVQKLCKDNMNNVYVSCFMTNFIHTSVADKIVDYFSNYTKMFSVYFIGEIIGKGIQDLHYHEQKQLRIFDVFVDELNTHPGRYLDHDELQDLCKGLGLKTVPVLYSGKYNYDKIVELRDGKTIEGNNAHIREGVVIKTRDEEEHHRLPDNRKQLKFVSPDYLLRKNGTELQ